MRQQATCGCRRRSRIRFLRSIFLRNRGGGGGCRLCCCRMVCHLWPKTILCCSSLPVEVYKALEEERNGKTFLAPVHLHHHAYRTHLFTHGLVCNCCSLFLRGGETTTAKASSWLKAGRLLCMDRVGTTWVSPSSFFLRTQAQRTLLLLLLRPSAQLLVPPPPLLPFAFSLSALPRDLLLFPFLRWLGFAQASGLEKTLSFLSPSSSLDGAPPPPPTPHKVGGGKEGEAANTDSGCFQHCSPLPPVGSALCYAERDMPMMPFLFAAKLLENMK